MAYLKSWPAMRFSLLAVVFVVNLAACSEAFRWGKSPPTGSTTGPGQPSGQVAGRGSSPSSARPGSGFHVVRAGETLYSIAFRYGLSPAVLARWNNLGDGTLIRVGQRLRLSAPGSAGAPPSDARRTPPPMVVEPPPRWQWPVTGQLTGNFGDSPMTASGIQIGGRSGEPVRAAAAGQVVYSGSGLVGYGELLIIKHNESWLSAYGYNQALLVQEGDRVSAGQQIARMGEGPGRRPLLHFEIRRNGDPVNPLGLLPARASSP